MPWNLDAILDSALLMADPAPAFAATAPAPRAATAATIAAIAPPLKPPSVPLVSVVAVGAEATAPESAESAESAALDEAWDCCVASWDWLAALAESVEVAGDCPDVAAFVFVPVLLPDLSVPAVPSAFAEELLVPAVPGPASVAGVPLEIPLGVAFCPATVLVDPLVLSVVIVVVVV